MASGPRAGGARESNPSKSLARSGLYRLSTLLRFTPPERLGLPRFRRRRGLRWRLSVFLIVATLVPVIVVAVVAAALVFSSVEQGIEFEAQRGLQVARALLLGEVHERAKAAAALGNEAALLDALARTPMDVRHRLAELSERQPSALLEVTDAVGRVLARCAGGTCNDAIVSERFAAFDPADRSPVVRRALEFERTISIEPAGNWLVVRAAFPLVDPALRLLGAAVVSASIDGPVADRVKAELGAAREVIFYRGTEPSASTFTAATGARLIGPPLPAAAAHMTTDAPPPVVALEVANRAYSVAFGPIQDPAGRRVGFLGVALDRETLAAARRRVTVTLLLGALSVLLIAIGLADVLARRLTRPLQNLHAGAMSIALGNLDTRIDVDSPDELGDVAEAFRVMIQSLKENQEGLAARVRELVTVHQIGRTISSVVNLDQLLRAVVTEALTVLRARTVALALVNEGAKTRKFNIRAVAGEPVGRRLADMAERVAERGRSFRTAAVEGDADFAILANSAGLRGPLLAAPLALKDRNVGVLLVGRLGDEAFSESDLRLLVTLADQTATAIENARLYTEVRAFSENLELKVRARTAELERAKAETERALGDLRMAQTQLAHSERMAGLGQLVAGIAHEVNSPAAAVQGSVDALQETVLRLEGCGRDVFAMGLVPEAIEQYLALVQRLLPRFDERVTLSALETRQLGRRLRDVFAGLPGANGAAAVLAELGPIGESVAQELKKIAGGRTVLPLCGYLRELAFLVRASSTIRTAIQSIRRIVGALKRYSRLDEAPVEQVDVHAGIEDTLVILAHQLKSSENGINLKRSYGNIPAISAYVGELNQVWTNLIHNAIQAMGNSGEILIETGVEAGAIRVAIQDDGPGIPPDVIPRIFDPFFTTKGKGEGTGLGLSISNQIVEKHGGQITVESVPGRTRFEVWLPIAGPDAVPVSRATGEPSQGKILLAHESGAATSGRAGVVSGTAVAGDGGNTKAKRQD
jgi:signal transduction histidine kinase